MTVVRGALDRVLYLPDRAGDGDARASRRPRPAVVIAALYVGARSVTSLYFLLVVLVARPEAYGHPPTIVDMLTFWDAQWYHRVALEGYPAILPVDGAGNVAENTWAFMPVYPLLARVAESVFGSWFAGAILISVVAGFVACLALFHLLRARVGDKAAYWAALFLATGPLAALFQMAYAEALFLALLLLVLLCLDRERYLPVFLLVPVLAYTRPGILALALLMGLLALRMLIRRRRHPLRIGAFVQLLALACIAGVLGLSWTVIAAVVTGVPDAYLQTELAWRRNWVTGFDHAFVPFEALGAGLQFWSSQWSVPIPVLAVLAAAVVALIVFVLIFEPHVKRLGVVSRLWTGSYLLYLAAVFFPQSSTIRLLLPTAPLAGAVAAPRSTSWRVTVLIGCLLAQFAWIYAVFGLPIMLWNTP